MFNSLKIKYILVFFIVLLSFFLLTSCFTTSLKKITIQNIEVKLQRTDNNIFTDKIIPGYSYNAYIEITTNGGKKIKNPNPKDISFSSPNNSVLSNIEIFNRLIFTFNADFLFAAYEDYILIIKSKYGKQVEFQFKWDVDWYNLPILNFKGQDGENGVNGYDGASGENGTQYSPNGQNGQDGSDGGDGENGENGKTVFLEIAYYKVPRKINGYYHDYFIIIYESISKKIYLYPLNALIMVDTSGGNGGNAGEGGKGGAGGSGYNGAPGGSPGSDGKPGIPGKGGDAGDIYVKCTNNFPIGANFKFVCNGGKAGNANLDFSKSNIIQTLISAIISAILNNMKDGKNGTVYISNVSIDILFNGISNPYFDKNSISQFTE